VNIIQIYQTEMDWLALVELDNGNKTTLSFKHEPTEAEVLELAASVEQPVETVLDVETEDGTIV